MEAAEDGQRDENLQQPWAQLPGENARWYGRFMKYLALGTDRTVVGVYNQVKTIPLGKDKKTQASKSWSDAYREFRWPERARAYDDFMRAEQAKEAVELRKKEQSMFLELQRQQVQDELAVARKLLLKAQDLLELPVEVTKKEEETADEREDGSVVVSVTKIIVPEHNSFRTAAQLVKQYSETSRLALRMPTQHTQFDVKKLTTDDLLAMYGELTKEEEELKNGENEKDTH